MGFPSGFRCQCSCRCHHSSADLWLELALERAQERQKKNQKNRREKTEFPHSLRLAGQEPLFQSSSTKDWLLSECLHHCTVPYTACSWVKAGNKGVGEGGQLTATLAVGLHVWLSSSIHLLLFTFLSLGSWCWYFSQSLVVVAGKGKF